MTTNRSHFGDLVRTWRDQRHLSQLALASEAEISQKHLSFIESGRSKPSRDMVLHLAEHLDVPLRERNAMLVAAGFAPGFPDRPLSDPALARARTTVDRILSAYEPSPALAVDRQWNMITANAMVAPLLATVDPELMKPPVNVVRASLHPRGLAPLIVNHGQWRAHMVERLRRQHRLTRSREIEALLTEVTAYPGGNERTSRVVDLADELAVPLRLRTQAGTLSFISTVTVFGTAVDITLAELSLEAFLPADDATATALQAMSRAGAR